MAVQGNLEDISLSSLISVNCNEMNKARLLLKREDDEASVYFEEGNIVHAILNSLEGEDVLYKLLRWNEGEFTLEQGVSAPKQTVNRPWSGIVLEGMKRLDEWEQTFEVDLEGNHQESELVWEEDVRKMQRDLSRVSGIRTVSIVDMEGNVYPQNQSDSDKQTLATAAFLFQRAKTIAGLLSEDAIQSVLVTGKEERLCILDFEGGICSAALAEKVSSVDAVKALRTVRARYQK